MKQAKLNLNFETVGSLVAMLVGICALFVTWDQAQVMRKQQHAAVWPILSANLKEINETDRIGIELLLRNDGVGPAIIKETKLISRNNNIETAGDFIGMFPQALHLNAVVDFRTSLGVTGAGQDLTILKVTWPKTPQTIAALQSWSRSIASSTDSEIDYQVCYCSVFDKCWVTNRQIGIADTAVKQCDNVGSDFAEKMIMTMSDLEQDAQ